MNVSSAAKEKDSRRSILQIILIIVLVVIACSCGFFLFFFNTFFEQGGDTPLESFNSWLRHRQDPESYEEREEFVGFEEDSHDPEENERTVDSD